MFAPVARWREYGWGETSGLPGLRLFVPMEISLCHPRQDQYMAWDNGGRGEGSPAFSSRLRKMRKNRSSQGQPVVRWQPGRLGSLLPLKGHGFLNLAVSLMLVRLAQLWALWGRASQPLPDQLIRWKTGMWERPECLLCRQSVTASVLSKWHSSSDRGHVAPSPC